MSTAHQPERRQLTVMLCDLVGWTALSTRIDAEELSEVVQTYRTRCTDIITRHGGSVAQYVGDAVLAYFGYPRAHEDDAERALRAALAIIAGGVASSSGETRVHIGIATGMVVVGNLSGDAARLSMGVAELSGDPVSAVGSALNLAARLQGLADPGMAVVSDQTRRLAGAMFDYADMGSHQLKGFEAPVQAWRLVGEAKSRSRFQALRASALTPLVDRRSELEELQQAWESVQAGQGRAVLLSAEPGVGKSRLAEVVSREIVDRRCLRLWYHCSPHLQSSPFAPLVHHLGLAAGFAETDDDAAKLRKLVDIIPKRIEDTAQVVPLLADLLSIDCGGAYPPLQMSAQRKKQRLFQALAHVLQTIASRRAVLLVIEDLHWIDPSSDELIGLLVERLSTLPLLAILTARPEFEAHWQDSGQLVAMRLRPLERSDSIAMIELLRGARAMSEATVSHIADQTDGLPLFIEDLTRDVLELQDLHAGKSAAAQTGRLTFAIPTTLSDSLMARLDRLGTAKRVAQIGATVGREFSYELLARVADLPEEELKEQLYRLVEGGLLIRPGSTHVLGYRFKHALVRDAAYSSLLKKDQVALHARIAKTLADAFPEIEEVQPELLAYHFEAARDIDNALDYLIKAAELSAKRSGFVEAITLLERALGLLETQARSQARLQREIQVHLALGAINAEYRGFSAGDSGAAYSKALELCRELGNPPQIFTALSGLGSFEITRSGFERCRALADECLSRASQQQTRPPFVMGHRLLGGTLFLTGRLAGACEPLEQAISLYEQDQSLYRQAQGLYVQDHKSTALCYLGLTLTILGHLERGLQAAESGLIHSLALGVPHTVNFSLCYLAAVHHIRRDPQEAFRRATESLELARQQGFATWVGISQVIRGEALVGNGDVQAGLAELAGGMKAHSGMEATTYQPFGISLFVRGLVAANRLEEALGALTQAIAISEKTGERFYLAELLRLKGDVLAKIGRGAEAEDALRAAVELARQQGARLFELRSTASLAGLVDASRRQAVLREMLEPVYREFEESVVTRDLVEARALLGSGDDAGVNFSR
jgi:class 3 adenylate cyclase/tetratricopeptide (TPR) repeat protein